MRFTRTSVKDLKLADGKAYQILWDETLPGFGLRVNPTGKVWVVQYRASGKTRRETIGRVEALSIDAARESARTTLARVKLGSDPYSEKEAAKARQSVTLRKVVDRYLLTARSRLKPRSIEEVERHLLKHWAPLHPVPIKDLTRAHVSEHLEEIARNSGPIASNRARASLSTLFTYAIGIGAAEHNPIIGTVKSGTEVRRDRLLTQDEIRRIWMAAKSDDYGRIIKMLLLTGQRREEVGNLRWSEIDLPNMLWTLPQERTKNHRAHQVPLSQHSVQLIREVPRILGRDFVFGARDSGYSGWSKSKVSLDRRIQSDGGTQICWRNP